MNLANKLFKGDRVIWIIFMFLCVISLVEVFSATSTLTYKSGNYWGPIIRHATMLLGGFALILILHNIPYRFFSLLILLLPVSAILLLLTPVLGKTTNEAERSLDIFGFGFQPLELGKLACIVFVAFLMSKRSMFTLDQIFYYILIGVGVICALIFPENLSTSVMLFAVCYMMMMIGQLPFKKMFLLTASGIFFAVIFVLILINIPDDIMKGDGESKSGLGRFATWKSRIMDFTKEKQPLDAATYDLSKNEQVGHAQIAIARGGILGNLPGHGQQRDFLPLAYADYIYVIIIEELGVAGGFLVLLLYIMLMIRVGMIARKCERLFPKYLVLGCGLIIVVQAFINMAVAVDLFPVTGQPLPLISRGGTSVLITCVYFGLILSVSRFGAGIGNEEDEEDETPEDSGIIEIETDISDETAVIEIDSIDSVKI